jgi:hypothetical protein
MQEKQDQRNFMGSVSSWEHLSLWFVVNGWLWTFSPWIFDGIIYALDALS